MADSSSKPPRDEARVGASATKLTDDELKAMRERAESGPARAMNSGPTAVRHDLHAVSVYLGRCLDEIADMKRQVEGLKKQRDEAAGVTGKLRQAEQGRDEALAKLATVQAAADAMAKAWHEARAEAARWKPKLDTGAMVPYRDLEDQLEQAIVEAAALREAVEATVRETKGRSCAHDGEPCFIELSRKALSQPGPGAAYQERMRKLGVLHEAVHRVFGPNPGVHDATEIRKALAALAEGAKPEEKP